MPKLLDIADDQVTNVCTDKCDLAFAYPPTRFYSFFATHEASCFAYQFQATTGSSPVQFNGNDYIVDNARLYSPSVHFFNGKAAPAEWILQHVPTMGGPRLDICIAIYNDIGGAYSPAGTLMSQLVEKTVALAPRVGQHANLSIPGFDLNTLVPVAREYRYYLNEATSTHTVVFSDAQKIVVAPTTIDVLELNVRPHPKTVTNDLSELFENSRGAQSLLAPVAGGTGGGSSGSGTGGGSSGSGTGGGSGSTGGSGGGTGSTGGGSSSTGGSGGGTGSTGGGSSSTGGSGGGTGSTGGGSSSGGNTPSAPIGGGGATTTGNASASGGSESSGRVDTRHASSSRRDTSRLYTALTSVLSIVFILLLIVFVFYAVHKLADTAMM